VGKIGVRLVLVLGCLLATALAGCGAKTGANVDIQTSTLPPLSADKGAITGVVIDDRYRPVPDALVLLTPGGLTATSDSEGQFAFGDLQPGSYLLQVQAPDHEAAPKNVDVVAGQYTEVEDQARRIFSDQGSILTTEFSVFIPCAASFVANGIVANCLLDLSGDTYRPGFTSKPLNKTLNWTVMVSEMLANQVATYDVQVRHDDGSPSGGERYSVGRINDGTYIKMVNWRGKINEVDNNQRNNVPFNGTKPFATILFLEGEHQGDAQGVFDKVCNPQVPQTCRTATGAGVALGIKAKFVQSLFVGKPAKPIESYCILAPKGCSG